MLKSDLELHKWWSEALCVGETSRESRRWRKAEQR